MSLIRILLRWLRLTVGPRLLDNSHGSQISLTLDTTQSLFPAPPLTREQQVCAGAMDCEDETNGGFRETVVMKLTLPKPKIFKNPLKRKVR